MAGQPGSCFEGAVTHFGERPFRAHRRGIPVARPGSGSPASGASGTFCDWFDSGSLFA